MMLLTAECRPSRPRKIQLMRAQPTVEAKEGSRGELHAAAPDEEQNSSPTVAAAEKERTSFPPIAVVVLKR